MIIVLTSHAAPSECINIEPQIVALQCSTITHPLWRIFIPDSLVDWDERYTVSKETVMEDSRRCVDDNIWTASASYHTSQDLQ